MARTCPLVHHRCMRELSIDAVHDATKALLMVEPLAA
jgi:hypothetical protein